MLTRLREIVEKVASAPRLNEALEYTGYRHLSCDGYRGLLGLPDRHDRALLLPHGDRGLKKPRGRTVLPPRLMKVSLAWLAGWRNLSTLPMRKNISFKYIPSVKEERFVHS
jgi:phosphotransferase system enzyme I (PtsP)